MMDITLEEAADQLEALGFKILRRNDHLRGIPNRPKFPDPNINMLQEGFGIAWHNESWTFSTEIGQIVPFFKLDPDLAVITQSVQDFYALDFPLDDQLQHDLRTMLIRIQWDLRLVVNIHNATTFRVRIPTMPDTLSPYNRSLASPSLAYRDEAFYIHILDQSWSLERRIGTETEFMMPLLHFDEVVLALRPGCVSLTARSRQ